MELEAGSFLAAFARAPEAVACALEAQTASWGPQELPPLRMGLLTGEAQLWDEVRCSSHAAARAGRLAGSATAARSCFPRCADLVAGHLPPGASLSTSALTGWLTWAAPSRSTSCATRTWATIPAPALPRPPPPQPPGAARQLRRPGGAVAELGHAAGAPRLGHHHRLGRVRQDPPGPAGGSRSPGASGPTRPGSWTCRGCPTPAWSPAPSWPPWASGRSPTSPQTETLTAQLAERDALILLDNCEHVLVAAAALAEALVRHCGRLVLLATSRQPLGYQARCSGGCPAYRCRRDELAWAYRPLTLPRRPACSPTGPGRCARTSP